MRHIGYQENASIFEVATQERSSIAWSLFRTRCTKYHRYRITESLMWYKAYKNLGNHQVTLQKWWFLSIGWQKPSVFQQNNVTDWQLWGNDKVDCFVDEHIFWENREIIFLQHLFPLWPCWHLWSQRFRNQRSLSNRRNHQGVQIQLCSRKWRKINCNWWFLPIFVGQSARSIPLQNHRRLNYEQVSSQHQKGFNDSFGSTF